MEVPKKRKDELMAEYRERYPDKSDDVLSKIILSETRIDLEKKARPKIDSAELKQVKEKMPRTQIISMSPVQSRAKKEVTNYLKETRRKYLGVQRDRSEYINMTNGEATVSNIGNPTENEIRQFIDAENREPLIVTQQLLKAAMKRAFPDKINDRDICQYVNMITNFFGYGNQVSDNELLVFERDIFYMLDDAGIIKAGIEENTTLINGRNWRSFEWKYDKSGIARLLSPEEKNDDAEDMSNVYSNMPEEAWTRGG